MESKPNQQPSTSPIKKPYETQRSGMPKVGASKMPMAGKGGMPFSSAKKPARINRASKGR